MSIAALAHRHRRQEKRNKWPAKACLRRRLQTSFNKSQTIQKMMSTSGPTHAMYRVLQITPMSPAVRAISRIVKHIPFSQGFSTPATFEEEPSGEVGQPREIISRGEGPCESPRPDAPEWQGMSSCPSPVPPGLAPIGLISQGFQAPTESEDQLSGGEDPQRKLMFDCEAPSFCPHVQNSLTVRTRFQVLVLRHGVRSQTPPFP